MEGDHVTLAEAKARLSALVDRVERGERIVIQRRGRPAAMLVPARSTYSATAKRARALRRKVRERVLLSGETWRGLAHEGHRH
jgi:prevent-host-death family protein